MKDLAIFGHLLMLLITAAEAQKGCLVDILFIFDTSDTVSKAFQKEVKVAEKIVEKLDLGTGKDQKVAAIEYSGEAELEVVVTWNSWQKTQKQLIDRLESLKYIGGKTLTAKALQFAMDGLIKNRRRNADLVIILLHDGISQDDPVPVAQSILKMPKTKIVAVGMSKLVLTSKLIEITGNKNLVFTGVSVDDVIGPVVAKVTPLVTCPAPKPTTAPTIKKVAISTNPVVVPSSSDCKVDFLFIFDTSDTVSKAFKQEVSLAEKLIANLKIGKSSGNRVGVIEYSGATELEVIVDWGESQETPKQLIEKIDAMKYIGGKTLTERALRFAMAGLIKTRRPEANLVIVLLHDGISQDNPFPVAAKIRQIPKTKIVAVGVSDTVLTSALIKIAGDKDLVFVGKKFEDVLGKVVPAVAPLLRCKEVAKAVDPPKPKAIIVKPDRPAIKPASGCKVDFLFIFDTSDTVAKAFKQEVTLAERIVGKMDLGPKSRHRVGVIEFSGTTELETIVDWGKNQGNVNELVKKMDDMKYVGGKTLAARALKYAKANMIDGKRRPDADLVIVMLHDGIPQDDPVPIAKQIRDLPRTKIIAVGIGRFVVSSMLLKITGDANHVFTGKEFQPVLDRLVPALLPVLNCAEVKNTQPVVLPPKATPKPTTTRKMTTRRTTTRRATAPRRPTTPAPRPVVATEDGPGHCRLDLLVVLDTSGSVHGKIYENELGRFLKIIQRLKLDAAQGSRVGYVTFAGPGTVKTMFSLNTYDNLVDIENAVRKTKFIGGTTDLASALRQATKELTPEKGTRPGNAVQVVILLSDGITTPDQIPVVARNAADLKSKAQRIYAVATDRYYFPPNLKAVASDENKWYRLYKAGEEERFTQAMNALTSAC